MALWTANALLLLVLTAACTGGATSTPKATSVAETPPDLAAIPAFTLNGCSGPSAETLNRGRCDPVNLVFPGHTFAEVTAALLEAGWTLIGIGTSETVLPPGSGALLPQAVQLFKADGPGLTAARFHIRLWQLPAGLTIGAVHHEGAGLNHDIDRDWEVAEAEVRRDLCTSTATCSEGGVMAAQSTAQEGSERWRGFRNNARPSLIQLTQAR